MDTVQINITTAPNEVTANITEAVIEVTINVTEGGGGLECADLAACQTIINIQEQLDNLPPGFGCEDLPACQTIIDIEEEITDLSNKKLGLIKIIDLNGDFFTDLASANAYISQFTSAPITDESYNNGVYYFTVPKYSDFSNANGFLSDMFVKTAAIIDEFGLISVYGENLLYNVSSDFDSFFGDVITCGINSFNNFAGDVTLHKIITDYTTFQNSVGTFHIHTIILTGANPTDFFLGSTATILTNKYNLSNANLLQASSNGANVFYDGIDKEDVKNKATDFTVLDNVKYPTTQATKDLVDYYVQSNIKIIGDWDATSGSYPLADESNTTPFITQWGATIKTGWAFRVGYGQAGTVDGFDYENGDVVYALIDNPTDNSSDWGDLDHNLQQATESLRGTAKIATAVIVADETSTDDERIVTTKKLWTNFLTRVLALAHTWALKQTFTTAPRFNSTTASQYLKVDGSKDLTSVGNIPATDITTDTTHRFITDTQLTNLGNQSGTNSGNESASSIATIHHGAASKSVLVDADEVPGQDSTSSYSLIRTTWLQAWTYIKSKSDSTYLPISPTITDYAATSTIVGFSSFTTKVIQVINMGAYDVINYDLGGNSNATTLTFTIPNSLSATAPAVSNIMHSQSGATFGSGIHQIANGSTTVNCYFNVSSAVWSASSTKRVRGTIIVQK